METGTTAAFTSIYRSLMAFLNGLKDDILDIAEAVLPVALPVLGIAIAVTFGVKFIKKVMR